MDPGPDAVSEFTGAPDQHTPPVLIFVDCAMVYTRQFDKRSWLAIGLAEQDPVDPAMVDAGWEPDGIDALFTL